MSIPSVYNALRFTGLGEDLQVTEKDVLPLPANEVLVKVEAASINPVDIQLWRSGLLAVVSGDKGMGRDFSGTVVSVGKDVNDWSEGDYIFGLLFEAVRAYYLRVYLSANQMYSLDRVLSASIYTSIQVQLRLLRNRIASHMKQPLRFL